jgi:type IV pilus assembly protein PilW
MNVSLAPRARMSGLSLVELMIAMSLGLVTVAAVGWVYLGTMQTYRTHDALSRLQEGARQAFELISKDLRMTGGSGCSHATSISAINGSTDRYRNLFGQPLISSEMDGAAGTETEFSDSLTVLRADLSREYIVSAHNSGTSSFTLTAAHDAAPGQLMIATDCNHASLFQARTAAGSQITHTSGAGISPANATPNLGIPSGTAYTYGAGSRLYKLSSDTYYVDTNSAGVPSLFRDTLVGATATLTPEEFVEGVEDLRVTYAVDSTATPDGQADVVGGKPYLTGAEVSAAAALGGSVAARWSRVVSIRISLLMRSNEDRVVPEPQRYTYNGATKTATDMRLRKVFTHVIKLRNR